MIKVKICGISHIEDALTAAEAGADFLGMVFVPSRRQVTTETASEILAAIRNQDHHVETVGVFVNNAPEQVNAMAAKLQLDRVQLSGDEDWDYCLQIDKPIIKVIHIMPETNSRDIFKQIELGNSKLNKRQCSYLLDTSHGDIYGGTGKTFNWQVAKEVTARFPVIIAGGLNPDNAGELIKEVNPWGVDVSSGVETKGQKDSVKIRAFIESVRHMEYQYDISGKQK